MKKKCMLIPGNPAIADHYTSWAKQISEAFPDMNVVYATSYVLFSRKIKNSEYDARMTKHYEEIFMQFASSEKITIIAHSVGSYFALRLLEKHADKIEKIVVIFPYIGYSAIKSLKYLPVLYWVDRVLPLVETVVTFKNFFNVYGKDIHNISRGELICCLRFGLRQCVYFEKNKFNTGSVAKYKDKISFIYTQNDRWCPAETIELLREVSASKEVGLPHDFIVDEGLRKDMIQYLSL